jgi:predicted O-methyltransferase YrrM
MARRASLFEGEARPVFDEALGEINVGIANIDAYLASNDGPIWEGSSSPEELAYLMLLARQEHVSSVVEVGFNAGYSSYAFLLSHPDARVLSFDLGTHACVKPAKNYIDHVFPGRHMLIPGDSIRSIPGFRDTHPNLRFDLAFIDGGHSYEAAEADLRNIQGVCQQDATIVMDDLIPWLHWGAGPTRAWSEAVRNQLVIQEDFIVHEGMSRILRSVPEATPQTTRAWAVGRYVMTNPILSGGVTVQA